MEPSELRATDVPNESAAASPYRSEPSCVAASPPSVTFETLSFVNFSMVSRSMPVTMSVT